jgi:hypothetical protein
MKNPFPRVEVGAAAALVMKRGTEPSGYRIKRTHERDTLRALVRNTLTPNR